MKNPILPYVSLLALGLALPLAAQEPPRGQPIKPLAPKGEPIKPLAEPSDEPARLPRPREPRGGAIQPLTAPSPKPVDTPAAVVPAGDESEVGFDQLSAFKYEVPDENADSPFAKDADPDTQIPETVKAYSGKRVSLKGFMLPLKVEQGLVTELLIMRDQSMCCFGTVPRINEWVSVKMTGKGVKPVMDQAVTLVGTLKVGAIRENGYLVGIYQMDGERMDGAAGVY